MTGSKTTLREDLWDSFINPPQMRPPSPFVEELNKVSFGIETVFLYFLYGVIALATGFIVYFFRTLPQDSSGPFCSSISGWIPGVHAICGRPSVRAEVRAAAWETHNPARRDFYTGCRFHTVRAQRCTAHRGCNGVCGVASGVSLEDDAAVANRRIVLTLQFHHHYFKRLVTQVFFLVLCRFAPTDVSRLVLYGFRFPVRRSDPEILIRYINYNAVEHVLV